MPHTPRPWKTLELIDGHTISVVADRGEEGVLRLADCAGLNQPANAQLIAAAPDLLEACKGVLVWADLVQSVSLRHGRDHHAAIIGESIIELAAAISKAEEGA